MNAEASLDICTRSPEETEQLGYALARLLPPGGVVALYGELASGKTCLVRGMASWFADGEPIHSPTFTLVNEYGAEDRLYHLDCYRLAGPAEMADLGYEELFDGAAVCAIEWAERIRELLPERRLDVTLEHAGDDLRRLTFTNRGLLEAGWQDRLGPATKKDL
jgi:tRNA threonylcarbamoyladenosine biosynthesis protein TsaE